MIKNKWFRAAAFLALLVNSAVVFAAGEQPRALEQLYGNYVFDVLTDLPAPAAVPEAAAPAAEEKAKGAAPAPGKSFTPVVYDAARVKAIMKLVSDIYNGKPLPYSQDGVTFKNKEGRLPQMPVGYYKEYTLLTGDAPHTVKIGETTYQVAPDLSARGSERVIVGGGEKIYYSPDHYAHFIQLTVVY